METLVYVVLILTAVLSIWQFASQSLALSTNRVVEQSSVAVTGM